MTRPRSRDRLDRDRLDAGVDAAFVLVLGAVASFGLRQTFHGNAYLVAAVVGLVLGIALAWLSHALRQPLVLLAVFTIAAFFLLGGAVALHAEGVSAMLPLPRTLAALADASVHGWKDLLTTLAPVDGGPLLTLPYLMALASGAASMAIAVRTRGAAWPLLPSTAYLVAVILLGIQTPSGAAWLGAVFAVLAISWIALRARRNRPPVLSGRSPWLQRGLAVAMVLGTGLLATVVHLPGTTHPRVVLRSYVSPPFNVGQYPSPLAGFRRYTKGYQAPSGKPEDHLYERTLMTVRGLPAGTLLRFASLDDYDGDVWAAASQSPGTSGASGAFQRVGSVIPEDVAGHHVSATVTIAKAYDGQVWLPAAGALTRLGLGRNEQEQFRYNLATSTGIVPGGLHEGETYTFSAIVPTARVDAQLTPATTGASLDTSNADFEPVASRWSQGANEPMQQVLSIARYLHDQGRYTDGGPGEEQYSAGHSVARLSRFSAEGVDPTGDDEQYAAMLALLANQLGVPARAVLGAKVPAGGVVKGADVHAWVELRDDDGVWRTLPTSAFMSTERPPVDTPPQPQQLVSGQVVPPPAPVRPPATNGDPYATTQNHRAKQAHHTHTIPGAHVLLAIATYAGPPLLLVALVAGGIVGTKAWRRRRRRTRGAPAHRLAAAWRELIDHARDLGHGAGALTGRSTRREQARQVGLDGFTAMARAADAHVFGAPEPTEADASSYWSEVDRLRHDLSQGTSRWRRLRAALSLASLRPPPRPQPREVSS